MLFVCVPALPLIRLQQQQETAGAKKPVRAGAGLQFVEPWWRMSQRALTPCRSQPGGTADTVGPTPPPRASPRTRPPAVPLGQLRINASSSRSAQNPRLRDRTAGVPPGAGGHGTRPRGTGPGRGRRRPRSSAGRHRSPRPAAPRLRGAELRSAPRGGEGGAGPPVAERRPVGRRPRRFAYLRPSRAAPLDARRRCFA